LSVAAPWILSASLALAALFALSTGRYPVSVGTVCQILLAPLTGTVPDWSETEALVVWIVRVPRVLMAALIGGGLALAGAALQSVFRNPLADPQILGVSSGAALGGVFGLLLAGSGWPLIAGSFAGGIAALAAVFWLAGGCVKGQGGAIMMVLAGLVVGAVGAAGIALAKFAADPENQLPAIVFWLLGSLADSNPSRVWLSAPPVLLSAAIIFGLRFHLSALTVGEGDARALGIPVRKVRLLALTAAGLITAASVAACGIVGWVGLVVPHLVRLGFGHDYRRFFLNAALAGATYLMIVDTLARTLTPAEIPLGALTALLGAPVFAFLLRRMRKETDA
jgi:iron complex transport system permease protein